MPGDRLAEQGIEFLVSIAPNKERLCSEYIPDYLGEPAQVCMVNQVVSCLRSHTDIRVVYPYEELAAYKNAHPQQYLYYQMDTHWNELGAYIGAKALLKELGTEILPLDELDFQTFRRDRGDLLSLLNLWDLEEAGFGIRDNPNHEQEPQTLSNVFDGIIEFEMSDVPERNFFMYKDSFGSGMAPYLKHYFSHTLMVHNIVYDPAQVWEEKPDIYVLEVLERYVRRLRNPIL